jgi:hypothetical protein
MNRRQQHQLGSAVVVDAVWHGNTTSLDNEALCAALCLAERNHVQGLLARAYPARLAGLLARVEATTAQFHSNLEEVTRRLCSAGVRPILIKADHVDYYVYTNFDLVVGEQLATARRALAGWYSQASVHPLEPDKVLLHPPVGPAAHIHRTVSWFGIPIIRADRLASHASETGGGWLKPSRSDELRIWLAHAAFQNLAFDLSELLALRDLISPEVVAEARVDAQQEGWRRAFDETLHVAWDTITSLDARHRVRLPVPLSPSTSLAVLRQHVRHLFETGQASAAVREVVLRAPLAAVKRFRLGLA